MKHRSLIKALCLLCVLFTLSSAQSVKLVKPSRVAEHGDCEYIKHIPYDERCEYLQNETKDVCDETEGFFFNYAEIIYCGHYNLYGVLFAFAIVLIHLFLIIALTADVFFCPALATIAIKLGMSENLAGVSLVAFGNGAPDLFTSMSHLTGVPHVELVYSHLMGGGIFMTHFVVGIICIKAPFRVEGKLFIRDCIFVIAGVIWTYMVLRNPRVYIWEAVIFLIFYGVYVITVLLTGSIRQNEEGMESKLNMQQLMLKRKKTKFDPKELMYMQMVIKTQCARKHTEGMETEVIIIHHGPFREFLEDIWPFEGWRKMSTLGRIFCIWKAPYEIFLRLVIPIVDYEAPKHGWCKVLNIINILLLPIYANIVTATGHYHPFVGVPLILITFLLGISLAIFVYYTSTQMEPPVYHSGIFATLAFIGSVVTIYVIVNEVIANIEALGLIIRATPTTLGCTLHAWGNSIGDFVTIYHLAKKGYSKMAFAGVYGSSIFNMLLSLGLAATFATVINGRGGKGYFFPSDIGTHGTNMLVGMLSGLVSCLIMLPVLGFQARKSFGQYLLFIYALFNLNILLNEFGLIHPLESVYLQQITYPNGTVVYKNVEVIYD